MIPRAEAVWVTETIVWGDRKAPGLLLGWEKRDGAWWGMCVFAQTGAGGAGPYVTQTWVPAGKIEQRGEDEGSLALLVPNQARCLQSGLTARNRANGRAFGSMTSHQTERPAAWTSGL